MAYRPLPQPLPPNRDACAFIRANHEPHTVCLPRQFAWIDELADGQSWGEICIHS
ncbi:hypothetical protein [Azospirillum melinis]